ncbi:hypothetical protein EDB85DRAFT_1896757 [Lactarius pseudohatsudake]|nr:hypothetical protein EDB85DRAFT_1896757 [Lactarius pseudohatsudake]
MFLAVRSLWWNHFPEIDGSYYCPGQFVGPLSLMSRGPIPTSKTSPLTAQKGACVVTLFYLLHYYGNIMPTGHVSYIGSSWVTLSISHTLPDPVGAGLATLNARRFQLVDRGLTPADNHSTNASASTLPELDPGLTQDDGRCEACAKTFLSESQLTRHILQLPSHPQTLQRTMEAWCS